MERGGTWIVASVVVYDDGADNERLLSLAPNREPFGLDASMFRLERLAKVAGGTEGKIND